MEDVLRLCGIAILGLCAVLLLRERNLTFAVLCGGGAVLVIALYLLESGAITAVQTITDAAAESAFADYAAILIKALAIAYILEIAAELL